jgi:hypothetical protein
VADEIKPSTKSTKNPPKTATIISAITAAIIAAITGLIVNGFMQKDFAPLKEFVAPDKSFAILLPVGVREQDQTVPTNIGPIKAYFFSAKAKYHQFTVGYSDYPDSFIAKSNPTAMLDGSRDGEIKNLQGKLLGEGVIDIQGHPGRELRIEGPQKLIIKSRIYLVGKRLYQIMAISKQDHARDKKITEVFGSFRIEGM